MTNSKRVLFVRVLHSLPSHTGPYVLLPYLQMIVEPEQRVADFAKAGADIISVHAEQSSTIHLHRVINMIKDLGCDAGVVLNPGTPLETIEYVLDQVDLILIMSVNPGFGGQKFIESQVDKIAKLRAICNERVGPPSSLHCRPSATRCE